MRGREISGSFCVLCGIQRPGGRFRGRGRGSGAVAILEIFGCSCVTWMRSSALAAGSVAVAAICSASGITCAVRVRGPCGQRGNITSAGGGRGFWRWKFLAACARWGGPR